MTANSSGDKSIRRKRFTRLDDLLAKRIALCCFKVFAGLIVNALRVLGPESTLRIAPYADEFARHFRNYRAICWRHLRSRPPRGQTLTCAEVWKVY